MRRLRAKENGAKILPASEVRIETCSERRHAIGDTKRPSIVASSGRKRVRTSRLGRMAMLGGMAARLAGDAAVAAGRLATTASSQKAAAKLHQRAARTLLASLGEMKGLPMKIGQLLSYIDDQIPEAHRHIYRDVLRDLQVKAQPFAWETMAAVIEDDLGERAATLLDALDTEPIAAASIGQVYRGRLVDGREIAVKVQYPGIAEAIGGDLKSVESVVSAMSLVLPNMDLEQTLSDVTSRLSEECDYEHELASQRQFAERWHGDAECYVPEVVEEFSGKRVLVTELVHGKSFHEIESASEAERSRVGRVLARFVFRSLYVHGVFNADPHPGNYLFMDDGRVAFIDYGCVQPFARDTLSAVVQVRHMVTRGERGAPLRRLLGDAYGVPELEDELWIFIEDYLAASFAPLIAPQPFRYTRAFTEDLSSMTIRGKLMFARHVLRSGIQEAKQPGLVFLSRINFGLASILAMLEAEGNWRAQIDAIDVEGGWLAEPAGQR
jgi:hypothetical protein